jgi:hypothetical protein
MKPDLKIRYNIDGVEDTYYDFRLYLGVETNEPRHSTLTIVAKGSVVITKNLSTGQVMKLIKSVKRVRNQFDGEPVTKKTTPSINYRLRISSNEFKLDYFWDSDGIEGFEGLFKSLMRLVKSIERIHAVDYEELRLPFKL